MTIQDWGAVGEIIGAIAVVASLVYLAIQIRQNTRQLSHSIESMKLSAFERNIQSGNRIRELLILHPEIAELTARGFQSFTSLSGSDRLRLDMLLRNMFAEVQGSYIRNAAHNDDSDNIAGLGRTVDMLLGNPGVREWLEGADPDWRREFRTFIDQRLEAFQQPPDDGDS